MGRLDSTIQMLQERRRAAPKPADLLEREQPERFAQAADSPYLNQMIDLMDRQYLRPGDVKEGFIALASGMVELDKQMGEVAEALGRKPESFDDVKADIAALRSGLATLVKAIQGIKLPDVKVPDYRDPDLSPIQNAIGDLKVMVASMERVAEVAAPDPIPTEWTFDVKRTQGGYIKSIEAKAK